MDTDTHLLSANQYIALIAVVGMILWAGTQAVVLSLTFEVTKVLGVTGAVISLWVVYTVGSRLFGAAAVDTRVWLSSPFLLWLVVSVLALGANAAGVVVGDTGTGRTLMWLPWGLAFTVGYLGTWGLVDRGGVYLMAGLASAGYVVAATVATVAGLHFAILGVLHGVPMLVDAARGGRGLTPDGTPTLRLPENDG